MLYSKISVGDRAPAFTLLDDAGQRVSLSTFRGRRVVLYFYPKDSTTGCTIEACEFRDLLPRFDNEQAVVLGISPDPVKSHAKFKAKFALTFPLLADTEHAVAESSACSPNTDFRTCSSPPTPRTTRPPHVPYRPVTGRSARTSP